MIHDAVAAPGMFDSGIEGEGEGRRDMGHGYGGLTNNFLFFQINQVISDTLGALTQYPIHVIGSVPLWKH